MDKKKLIKLYREMNPENLTFEEARKELDTFTKTLKEALMADGRVKFIRRGVFEVFARQPRTISNPATKERITIYPKKTVRFRASKNLSK